MTKIEDKNRYLLKNTLLFAIGNLGTKLINFLMVPLYSYVLTTEEYGIIDFVFTFITVLIPIISLNICEAIQRFSLDSQADHGKIYTNSIMINLIGFVVVVLSYPLIVKIFNNLNTAFIITSYICFYALYMSTTCMLRGKEELFEYTICNIMLTLLICILNCIFLVCMRMGLDGYFLAYTLSYALVAGMAFVLGKQWKYLSLSYIDIFFAKKLATFSIALVPNAFLWWIVNSSDRIMVSSMCGYAENGLYAMAYKIPSLLSVFSTIFMQAWGFSAIREKECGDNEDYQNVVFQNLATFMGIVAIGMMVILKPIVTILLSDNYKESWRYSPFLLVGFFMVSLASFAGTTYYVNKDSVRQMYSAIGGALINVILNLLLIPRIGANGASVATCIAYVFIFLYRVYDTRKEVKLIVWSPRIMSIVILLLLAVRATYIERMLFSEVLLIGVFVITLILGREPINNIVSLMLARVKGNKR